MLKSPSPPVLALALLLLACGRDASAQAQFPPVAEFPPDDIVIWRVERQGMTAALAARGLREAPDAVETVRLLAAAEDIGGLLATLRRIVETRPRRMADALEAARDTLWKAVRDDEPGRRHTEQLRQLAVLGRTRLAGLPREEAARAARVFVHVDALVSRTPHGNWADDLRRFSEQYQGTDAALLAEVDAIAVGRVSQQMFDALDAFVHAHPGIVAAARAQYHVGFQWHTVNTLGILEPRGADPTNRFFRVLAIVTDLESGRYPPCEWVDRAPELVSSFFVPDDATIAPGSVARLLEAFVDFARTHFVLHDEWPARAGIGHLLTSKVAALHARDGEGVGAVERTLGSLARDVPDRAAVDYLHGLFYLELVRERAMAPAERGTMIAKARDVLAAVAGQGSGLYHRRALATLASLEFREQQYAAARAALLRYVATYPHTSWAWVARLRAAQCEDALGHPLAAADSYLAAAETQADLPLARVLGHEYAARAYETAGDVARALVEHQRALAGWDDTFGLRYSTYVVRSPAPQDSLCGQPDAGEVRKESLAVRIAQLQQSLALAGGEDLERGRTLLASGRHRDAIGHLQRLAAERGRGPVAEEAASLALRARLERALQLADAERADADEAGAMREFDALAAEVHDFAATAAAIAGASLQWTRGRPEDAEQRMRRALTEWQAGEPVSEPPGALERDVADLRRAVFLPNGGGVYGADHWNAFSFADAATPFVILNRDVTVRRHDGEVARISLAHPVEVGPKALFFDSDQLALLRRIVTQLGGRQRREPGAIMETPSQPVGDSMRILELWNRFFAARPGHWGGWELETYPVVTEIQFWDAARTMAAVKVTIGYSGATVELEKQAGRWVPIRLTNRWIT